MLRYIPIIGLMLVLLAGGMSQARVWHLPPLPEGADTYASRVCTFEGIMAVKRADDAAPPESTEAFDVALAIQTKAGECADPGIVPFVMVKKVDRLAQTFQGNTVWIWSMYLLDDEAKTIWYGFSPYTPARLMGVSI